MTVKDYKLGIAGNDVATKYYVKGLGEGITWTNNEMVGKTGSPLYCQPQNLGLTFDNYANILNRQIKIESNRLTEAQLSATPIVMLLIEGLRETFPCKGK